MAFHRYGIHQHVRRYCLAIAVGSAFGLAVLAATAWVTLGYFDTDITA